MSNNLIVKMKLLDEEISNLEELIVKLVENLKPISYMKTPNEDEIKQEKSELCPLANEIRFHRQRIGALKELLSNLIDSLEI